MTAREMLRRIEAAGGSVHVTPDRGLQANGVPTSLVPELKRLKNTIIKIILIDYMIRTFNLKPVSSARLREIEAGQQWRIVSAQGEWVWRDGRYRHAGEQ